MKIPTRHECFLIMERESLPVHVRRHCVLVARVATGLARHHVARGASLDIELIERASLLHDIAKMKSLGTSEGHGELGAKLVTEAGYSQLAPIIREHVLVEGRALSSCLNESVIVNYSDKRVQHDRIVDLVVRFEDLARRYGQGNVSNGRLSRVIADYRRLEVFIFRELDFGPSDLAEHLGEAMEEV